MDDAPSAGTILLADDEPDIVTLVARRLRKSGFTVNVAINGEEALLKARAQMPDLCLLDIMMPRCTGIEVSRQLRAAPETHAIPVILMSAGLFDMRMIPDVADAFITKPFQPLELPALVVEVLARSPRVRPCSADPRDG